MKKKILILGTGVTQADLIQKCKEYNFKVLSTSYTKGDFAETLCDEFALINITDKEAIRRYAEESQVEHIYSVGSDVAMPTVGAVAKSMGLPVLATEETAVICNNKGLLRKTLGSDFVGNIAYQILASADDEIRLEPPFMIKPIDSQGQRGVDIVNDMSEFLEKYETAKQHSRSGDVIIEEYCEGRELSVNTYSMNGKIIYCVCSDRIAWEVFKGGLIHKHVLPCKDFSEETEREVRDLVERVLKKIGLENGPAYFQIKLRNGHPKVLEATPRLDGCHMWRLIQTYSGNNLLEWSVRHLMGDTSFIDEVNPNPTDAMFETEFFCQPPNEEFHKDSFVIPEDVEYLQWYYDDGARVKKMNGFKEKCGYAIRRIK